MPAHATVSCSARRGAFLRKQLERLEQRRARIRELPGRGPCAGERRQELDTHGLRPAFAEQPQGRGEPACRRRRRALRSRRSGLGQERDRRLVSLPGRTLDVMHARRHRGSAGGQSRRAALVRAETPAARGRVIDGSPHERVAEAKTTRHVGLAHEVAAQQLVECRERGRLRYRRRGSHQLGLERVTRDGSALEYEAGAGRQQPELLRQGGDDGGRDPARLEGDCGERRGGARSTILGARELLEVERIATAVLVERRGREFVEVGAEQLAGLRQREGPSS